MKSPRPQPPLLMPKPPLLMPKQSDRMLIIEPKKLFQHHQQCLRSFTDRFFATESGFCLKWPSRRNALTVVQTRTRGVVLSCTTRLRVRDSDEKSGVPAA